MDKNTIWGIVLISIVLIGSFILMPLWNPVKPIAEQSTSTEVVEGTTDSNPTDLNNSLIEEEKQEEIIEEVIPEELITIKTNKAEIVLTNKGADIISYELIEKDSKGNLKNFDIDTGKGVQITDSITDNNRACSISFGNSSTPIVNDMFKVEKINERTYLFTKDFKIGERKFKFGKQYSFSEDEYMFKLDILLHTDDGKGLDFNGCAYSIRTSPQIGPHYDAKKDRYEKREFLAYNGKKVKNQMIENGNLKYYEKDFIWGGIAGKYFTELVVPADNSIISNVSYSGAYDIKDYANAQAILERRNFSGNEMQDTYYMYFGPRNEKDINIYNESENNYWKLSGKKLNMSLQNGGFFSWLESILKVCLELLYKIVHNWGVCIILLTLLIKILMFPLSKKQSISSLKMQEIQPRLKVIQDKYKNNQPKLQEEMQKLYKEANYNPASGCLPIIIQFFILMAMLNLFNNYFEFRGASFIPGWVPDLSIGDSVYTFSKDIPFIGTFLHINDVRILPIVYLISQLISGKITQNMGMSAGQSQTSMKVMMYGLPIIFFFVLYNAPSGLILYWLTSNILGVIQQIFINRFVKAKKQEMALAKNSKGVRK